MPEERRAISDRLPCEAMRFTEAVLGRIKELHPLLKAIGDFEESRDRRADLESQIEAMNEIEARMRAVLGDETVEKAIDEALRDVGRRSKAQLHVDRPRLRRP